MSNFTQDNEIELADLKDLRGDPKGSHHQDKIKRAAIEIDPKRCRPWQYHNRDMAWLTSERCADLISSIKKHGQHQPALVRPLLDDPQYEYEIIYGVRRWFSCSQIPNQKLWAYVAELDDKTCTILMHTENANSKDITEFERAFSFAQQLKSRIYKNQVEMADALGLSQGNISKMIRASEIFDYDWIRTLFNNKLDIPIKYAYILSIYLKKPDLLPSLMNEAKLISNERKGANPSLTASTILKRLISFAKSNHSDPAESVMLTSKNKSVVSCRKDKFGKVHITIDEEAKSFSPEAIHKACLDAIHKFIFSNYSPENKE